MKKLWEKGFEIDKEIEKFTIGKDRELDMYFAKYDVLGTLAHISMLKEVGLISNEEFYLLKKGLKEIYYKIENNQFNIEEGIEDIHSAIEFELTKQFGEVGKKVHTARSRNDQVLLDLKLYFRSELLEIAKKTKSLFDILIELSEKYKDVLIPGYTHLQIAMPSSFGLWFGAYAESLSDDLMILLSAFQVINQNPLGSAAGYGTSLPIKRQITTDLLAFDRMNYNVVNAQMGRGKVEKIITFAISMIAGTLSKMANDICLYLNQNFGFLSLPEKFTTGSSIMPQKKNPDVFELLRAKCNKIQSLQYNVMSITSNLPSGYFRDMQILKEIVIPAIDELKQCIDIACYVLPELIINKNILEDEKYKYIFAVELVNEKVLQGKSFRDAYKEVADSINNGTYEPKKEVRHTHEGSIGNLCNEKIKEKVEDIIKNFPFEKVENAYKNLLS